MRLRRKKRGIGLGTKLNIILIVCILVITLGLVRFTYGVYCRKVDSKYYELAERAARYIAKSQLPYETSAYLRKMTDTDEFREVRARAVANNDEQIIRDWMLGLPSYNYSMGYVTLDPSQVNDELGIQYFTLYGDYETILDWSVRSPEEIFGLDVYILYVVDGVSYRLADNDMSLMDIGTAEKHVEAFAQYAGNDRIPPTIYQYGDDWLCTACEPILEEWEGVEDVAVAQLCVDIDMNDVIRERHWFLINSALFIVVFILSMMAVTLLLTRRLVTRPLKQLSKGTAQFEMRDEGFSREDVIELPIRSNDEIGELYREIKLMEERIVDNADKLTHAESERERVKTELDMAARIQKSALPRQFPAFPDRQEIDLYASMDPAKLVGGDFYDFFLVDDDHLALVIADVSDKGVHAALFMMSAKIILKYRARMGGSPGEILTSVNAQLCLNNPTKMFVTVWLGILELSTGRLSCTNAGHEYPIIRQPDGAFELFKDKHEIFVGAMRRTTYSDYEICLKPGSKVFVYTDGLAEAINTRNEQFGTDRAIEALNLAPDSSPRELLDNVRRAVDAFVGGADQFDDLTMLCVEYRGPEKAARQAGGEPA